LLELRIVPALLVLGQGAREALWAGVDCRLVVN
jgi:hypothetical protein